MAFDLQIHFAGLIAWIFDKGLDEGRALLLRVNEDHPYEYGNGHQIPAHYPGLLFGAGTCVAQAGECPTPSPRFLKSLDLVRDPSSPFGTEIWGGLDLPHHRVSLKFNGAHTLKVHPEKGHRPPANDPRRAPLPDSHRMRSDISFLADMGRLCLDTYGGDTRLQRVLTLDPRCNNSLPEEFHPRVAAAFEIPGGTLEVLRLGEVPPNDCPKHIPVCRFHPIGRTDPEPTLVEALADHLLLTIANIDDDSLEVHIDGRDAKQVLTLTPTEENPRVVLFVADRPMAQIPPPPADAPADHFQVFFDLSKEPVSKVLRPVPFPQLHQTVPNGLNGPYPLGGLSCRAHPPAEGSFGRPICPQVTFTGLE